MIVGESVSSPLNDSHFTLFYVPYSQELMKLAMKSRAAIGLGENKMWKLKYLELLEVQFYLNNVSGLFFVRPVSTNGVLVVIFIFIMRFIFLSL